MAEGLRSEGWVDSWSKGAGVGGAQKQRAVVSSPGGPGRDSAEARDRPRGHRRRARPADLAATQAAPAQLMADTDQGRGVRGAGSAGLVPQPQEHTRHRRVPHKGARGGCREPSRRDARAGSVEASQRCPRALTLEHR